MGNRRKKRKTFQPSSLNQQQRAASQKTNTDAPAEENKSEALKKDSGKEVYIVWAFLAAILTWLLGCFLYDYLGIFISLILAFGGALGAISSLFTIFDAKVVITDKRKKCSFLSISVGTIIGAALSFWVCNSLGFRLKLIPVAPPFNSQETAETLDAGAAGTEIPEIHTEKPSDDPPEEEGLPIQEPVVSDAPGQNTPEANSADSAADPDPNTPITVTVSPEGDRLMSFNVLDDFYQMIGISDTSGLPSATAASKEFLESVFTDKIRSFLNTNSLPDGSEINQNRDFTSETEAANKEQQDIKDNGQSLNKQKNLIRHREKAYEIYPAQSLDNLLSYDYSELARLYKREEKWEDAYQCYLKSIEHEILYIKSCTKADDLFYVRLYNVAVRCHGIGDMDGLNTETKLQAYYLAVCLFEATSKNEFSDAFQNHQAKCYYYAGMANHKLLNLYPDKYNSETLPYFLHSYMFYEKSLQYPGDSKYKHTYLAQLCRWAQTYIKRQGAATGMKTREEYEQLESQYMELGW